jgi:hypothetical protein
MSIIRQENNAILFLPMVTIGVPAVIPVNRQIKWWRIIIFYRNLFLSWKIVGSLEKSLLVLLYNNPNGRKNPYKLGKELSDSIGNNY